MRGGEVFEVNGSSGIPLDEVAHRIHLRAASVIAIDGLPGVGKTSLSARLSARLTMRTVHLDDYLTAKPPGFTNHLDYAGLQCALIRRPVIVEGVCMLDVLDRLELRPGLFIYLQAPTASRYLDRDHPLVREVHSYTERARPVEQANLVLTRSACETKTDRAWVSRRMNFDAYVMRNRSRVSLWLAAAGMVPFTAGAIIAVIGRSACGDALTGAADRDLSLVGAGLLTMLVSAIWIFLARTALPRMHGRRSP